MEDYLKSVDCKIETQEQQLVVSESKRETSIDDDHQEKVLGSFFDTSISLNMSSLNGSLNQTYKANSDPYRENQDLADESDKRLVINSSTLATDSLFIDEVLKKLFNFNTCN